MPAFLKSLSRMFGGKADPELFLTAFGKHPGWNDHIDDIGLDTQALIHVKRLLYLQGINQNIDGGNWENPDFAPSGPACSRLADFRHEFLWLLPPDLTGTSDAVLVAGRLWSSIDGKGRAKYPMVLAAQTSQLPLSFAMRLVLPTLAKVHDRCTQTTAAEGVIQTVDAARNALRSKIAEVPPPEPLTVHQLETVANHPDMRPHDAAATGDAAGGGGGFHRIVYAFLRTLSPYLPGSPAASSRRPEQLRVPLAGLAPSDALAFWFQFASSILAPDAPLLLFVADPAITGPNADVPPAAPASAAPAPSAGWVDILVGEPSPQNLFAIKAGAKSVPLTSDIPYTLDPSFVRAIDNYLHSLSTLPPDSAPPALPSA